MYSASFPIISYTINNWTEVEYIYYIKMVGLVSKVSFFSFSVYLKDILTFNLCVVYINIKLETR